MQRAAVSTAPITCGIVEGCTKGDHSGSKVPAIGAVPEEQPQHQASAHQQQWDAVGLEHAVHNALTLQLAAAGHHAICQALGHFLGEPVTLLNLEVRVHPQAKGTVGHHRER